MQKPAKNPAKTPQKSFMKIGGVRTMAKQTRTKQKESGGKSTN